MDAHRAEAIAAKEGLMFAKEMGLNSIILEGDAKNVFETFESSEEDLCLTGIILAEAYSTASWFHPFKPYFVLRICNI